jgi:hypothetical protein
LAVCRFESQYLSTNMSCQIPLAYHSRCAASQGGAPGPAISCATSAKFGLGSRASGPGSFGGWRFACGFTIGPILPKDWSHYRGFKPDSDPLRLLFLFIVGIFGAEANSHHGQSWNGSLLARGRFVDCSIFVGFDLPG